MKNSDITLKAVGRLIKVVSRASLGALCFFGVWNIFIVNFLSLPSTQFLGWVSITSLIEYLIAIKRAV